MTLEEIKDQITKIDSVKRDDEVAHSMEDDLYYAFVDYLAEYAIEPYKTLAIELRKVRDIQFDRWHA